MRTVTMPEPKDIKNLFVKIPPRFLHKKFEFILGAVADSEKKENVNIPDSAFVLLETDPAIVDLCCRISWSDEEKFSMFIDDQITRMFLSNQNIKRYKLGDVRDILKPE